MRMRKLILLIAVWASAGNAAKSVPATYSVNGKIVSAEEAVLAVLKGGQALKCQPVEAKATKTGVNLKPKKAE
jgi:hypothetical protein